MNNTHAYRDEWRWMAVASDASAQSLRAARCLPEPPVSLTAPRALTDAAIARARSLALCL